jgi:RNA polymerase sigma-70 factor (ECF subfamily)
MLAALTDTAPPGPRAIELTRTERTPPAVAPATALSFDAIYDQHFDFVWRSLRRLGVRDALIDDAAQDVFVVVHKRLGDFEGRSSVKTWLFGVALRVARNYRRTAQRRDAEALPETVADTHSPGPHEATAQAEAIRTLHVLLDTLGDERRAVFVMMELEQMSAPEVAEALGVNLNTVYSRLRKARSEFQTALTRHRARSARP